MMCYVENIGAHHSQYTQNCSIPDFFLCVESVTNKKNPKHILKTLVHESRLLELRSNVVKMNNRIVTLRYQPIPVFGLLSSPPLLRDWPTGAVRLNYQSNLEIFEDIDFKILFIRPVSLFVLTGTTDRKRMEKGVFFQRAE